MKRSRKTIISSLLAFAGVLAVSSFPAWFLYCQNVDEMSITEITVYLICACVAGIFAFIVSCVYTRNIFKGTLLAIISVLAMSNYAAIEKAICVVIPELRFWHCTAIIAMLLFLLGIALREKLTRDIARIAALALGGMFCALIFLNFVLSVPALIKKNAVERELQFDKLSENGAVADRTQNNNNPNIYYIIVDEYAGFEEIKNVYGFNNDEFASFLTKRGFTVSESSRNDDIRTVTVTTNLANLDYVVDYARDDTTHLNKLRKTGKLFQLLRKQGYNLYGVGKTAEHLWGLDRIDGESKAPSSTSFDGISAQSLLFKRTIAYPFIGDIGATEGKRKEVMDCVAFLLDGTGISSGGTFILAHFDLPHTPFVFKKDGTSTMSDDWSDPKYYLGQYQYTTKLLKVIIEAIQARDSGAVIILQSDHGARASANLWSDKTNILNAVYVGGEPFEEMMGQSGVNTLRLLLNRIFGYDFAVLEMPLNEK